MTKEFATTFGTIHISTNMTGKLEGINALSTSVVMNMFCQARRCISGSICEKCYAESTVTRYTKLGQNVAENFEILTNHLLEVMDFPFTPDLFFRIEAFGDVSTVIQCRNYIRFCRRNPQTTFTAWTKNPAIWDRAFQLEGKPENLIMGLSSMFVNKPAEIRWSWVDFLFTVYTAEYAIEHDIEINCGGRHCIECRRCYTKHDGVMIVNEMLKSDLKKYARMMAKKIAAA